jgi:hypothetical protein
VKVVTIGGHHVRQGHYLIRTDSLPDNTGEPVRFFPHRRVGYLWRLVDRFNRLQAKSASLPQKSRRLTHGKK